MSVLMSMFGEGIIWTKSFSEMADVLRPNSPKLILIDGHFGAGKSRLAGQLSHMFQLKFLDIDDFCERGQGSYLPHIDYEKLNSEIDEVGGLVLSGAMVLAIVEKLNRMRGANLKIDAQIYVVRLSRQTEIWADDEYH
ncbi:MAG: Shikimate kinase [Rhizobium sp.]|nr:Shikimate kinase [Rhizobium sp.]